MKFSILKIAIAAVCLHGSITVTSDTSSDYLEDQSNYVQIVDGLSKGWHWGPSSANACGSSGDASYCYDWGDDFGDEYDWGDDYDDYDTDDDNEGGGGPT